MSWEFWKMEGGGNDFVVIDNREDIILEEEKSLLAKKVLRRKFGVGGDGLLLVEKSTKLPFKMRIFNPDGSEPEMCGNGARCIARFSYLKGIAPSPMRFETRAGIIEAEIIGEEVKILLPSPAFLKEDVSLRIEGKTYSLTHVHTGVPHAVLEVSDLEKVPVNSLGRTIRFHPLFQPEGTNVDFVKFMDEHSLAMRVYERGVEEETLCCGTGAVACAYAGYYKGVLQSPVRVHTRGGEVLTVYMEEGKIYLQGNARIIFRGEWEEKDEKKN